MVKFGDVARLSYMAWWGVFVKILNSLFFRCEGWNGLQTPPNEYHESRVHKKFIV